jgi:hypothetical protein
MSCRPFCVMLASMPAGTNSTVTIEGKQLLLTIGRAGVLSNRTIAAGEFETLLRLLGPPSERQRNLRRATDIVLIENGAVIYWPRTGGNSSKSGTLPMLWRACKRRSHEHRHS